MDAVLDESSHSVILSPEESSRLGDPEISPVIVIDQPVNPVDTVNHPADSGPRS